ncbi:MAG TPA: hypothetical protein VMB34_15620, partial [Acetobacteraceae bacterium]|nr:hypothetical protein [Acetobacteraceae bacterium]
MDLSVQFDSDGDGRRQILWGDSDRIVCWGRWLHADGESHAVLAVLPAAEHPSPASLARLAHEYDLRGELDEAWAVRP